MSLFQQRLVAVLITLIVGLSLGFFEIERLVSQLGTATLHFSFGDVVGPTAFANLQQWSGWVADSPTGTPAPFIHLHLLLDGLYIVAYLTLFGILIQRTTTGLVPGSTGQVVAIARAKRLIAFLSLLFLADVAEDVLLSEGARFLAGQSAWLGFSPAALATASTFKWVLTALLVIGLARALGSPALSFARRVGRGLYVQRLSSVLVLVLAILSLLPFDPLLEQLPDVQRGWFDESRWLHGLWAVLVLVLLACTFHVVGRKRAELYFVIDVIGQGAADNRRRYQDVYPGPVPPLRRMPGWHYAIWAAIPIIVGGVGLYLCIRHPELLDRRTMFAFVAIFGGILVLSGIAEFVFWWRRAQPAPIVWTNRPTGVPDTLDLMRVGDTLAALIIVIPAIGFARSLGTPLILTFTRPSSSPVGPVLEFGEAAWWLTLFVVSMLFALGVILARVWKWPNSVFPTGPSGLAQLLAPASVSFVIGPLAWTLIGLSFLGSAGFIVAVSIIPRELGATLGAVAVTVASLGAWVTLLALLMLILRRRRPLAITEALGFKSDPLIAMFLVIPFIVTQIAPVTGLHDIDRTATANPSRDDLGSTFHTWLDRSDGCVADVGPESGPGVRPLMLVAAEGGGIRAATWTVATMAALVESGQCAANSVFLSSGVSGGSIGLALAANPRWSQDDLKNADADDLSEFAEQLRKDVLELGNSDALPTAMSSFLITDQIAGSTGLRLPSRNSEGEWWDRAAMIEHSWRDSDGRDGDESVGGLDTPYDTDAAAPTGLVVLNSTDNRSACRVIVSQVELGLEVVEPSDPHVIPEPSSPVVDCSRGVDEPPLTVDLLDFLEKCGGANMDWATAGLISSRFPFVTPSGTVSTTCAMPRMQLIDGGYAENSGLGLLADSADRLAAVIRTYNTYEREPGQPLVVPYVMYIENSPASYEKPISSRDTSELLVPFIGFSTDDKQVASSSWIQRIMTSYAALCEPPDPLAEVPVPLPEEAGCAQAVEALGTDLDPSLRTIVMAASTEPSVLLPLGWGMSEVSHSQMVLAAGKQASDACREVALPGRNCLGAYLDLFGPSENEEP